MAAAPACLCLRSVVERWVFRREEGRAGKQLAPDMTMSFKQTNACPNQIALFV